MDKKWPNKQPEVEKVESSQGREKKFLYVLSEIRSENISACF